MAQTFLICPMCKYENSSSARYCLKCGRLLAEPNPDGSSVERAPLYHAPADTARWTLGQDTNIADARVAISFHPDEPDAAGAPPPAYLGEFPLAGRIVTVGRGQGCDIVLAHDTLVSRRHAILRPEGRHYTVADLGSSNGTLVNDIEIADVTTVVHGDRILIGQHELLLLLDTPTEVEQPTPQPPTIMAAVAHPPAVVATPVVTPAATPVAYPALPGIQADSPATATTKHSSAARLSSELAASASRMVAPPQAGDDLEAVRTRLIEASEALSRQSAAQAALAERRRAALVEAHERVADLISDLRRDEPGEDSPTQPTPLDLVALVERVAQSPDNIEALRALARHAGEVATSLRERGPTEGAWSVERARALHTLRDLEAHLRERI
ncbi:MAG: FHA domain-containing protein [Chloroflexota bacterium]|nr:FHA domain-containing protein [Chloroflexota bacterium]